MDGKWTPHFYPSSVRKGSISKHLGNLSEIWLKGRSSFFDLFHAAYFDA